MSFQPTNPAGVIVSLYTDIPPQEYDWSHSSDLISRVHYPFAAEYTAS